MNNKMLFGMVDKVKAAYMVLTVLALAALAISGGRIYELVAHFSPAESAVMYGRLTVVILNGGFFVLDMIFPYLKTNESRSIIGVLMAGMWALQTSGNVLHAVINIRADIAESGWGAWIVYAIAALADVYLLVYAIIRFNDPDTKRVLNQAEVRDLRDAEILKAEKEYSLALAPAYGQAIAIKNIADRFYVENGRSIESVLGKGWEKVYLNADQPAAETEAEVPPQKPASKRVPAAAVVPPAGNWLLEKARDILQMKNPTTPQA